MAIEITQVTQVRTAEVDKEGLLVSGKASYYVHFNTTTTEEYADYNLKAYMALTAVNPPDVGSENISNRIPQYGEQLVDINETIAFDAFVRNVVPKMFRGQNNWWQVDVTYAAPDTNDNGETGDVLTDDPENLEVKCVWDAKKVKKVLWKDFTPAANLGPLDILASNADPFTKLPVVDRSILTCTITRKTQGTYDPLVVAGVLDNINDAPMTICGKGPFPAKTVKLARWGGVERNAVVTKPGLAPVATDYDDETIVFEIDLEKWFGRVFDQGLTFFLESAEGGLPPGRHFMRRNGEVVDSAQPLNGKGLTVFNDDGTKKNNIVPQALPGEAGGVNGQPGIEEVGDQQGAMLLFHFFKPSNIAATIGAPL